jgi:hypothetical protein
MSEINLENIKKKYFWNFDVTQKQQLFIHPRLQIQQSSPSDVTEKRRSLTAPPSWSPPCKPLFNIHPDQPANPAVGHSFVNLS